MFACFLVSLLMSDQDLSNLIQNFQFIAIAVFTVIIFLLFPVRYEAGALIALKFNEPKLKKHFPRVTIYLVLTTLFLQVLGVVNVI